MLEPKAVVLWSKSIQLCRPAVGDVHARSAASHAASPVATAARFADAAAAYSVLPVRDQSAARIIGSVAFRPRRAAPSSYSAT